MESQHVDVLVVGAGVSGIGAACHLQTCCPEPSYAVLEARDSLGGTWDLFRHPGIRSHSDMYTFGYAFKPWTDPKSIADQVHRRRPGHPGLSAGDRVRARHRPAHPLSASGPPGVLVQRRGAVDRGPWTWSAAPGASRCATPAASCACAPATATMPRAPEFPGLGRFQGRIVHPQHWSDGIVHAGQRVLVIGSRATAVTLVPELAPTAAHVTMLQRSPTGKLPRQGSKRPWKLHQDYALDILALRFGRIDDGALIFSNPALAAPPAEDRRRKERFKTSPSKGTTT